MPVLCMHASSVCLLYRELTPKMTIIRMLDYVVVVQMEQDAGRIN
jgi:hypothetical protein